jgi:fatty-acyl-CoA synthase
MSDIVPLGGVARVSRRVMNLAHFLTQTARRLPHHIAFVKGEETWTWAVVAAEAEALAAALAARGKIGRASCRERVS